MVRTPHFQCRGLASISGCAAWPWKKKKIYIYIYIYIPWRYHFTLSTIEYLKIILCSVQLLSHVWHCFPMNRSTPGLPVHHQLPEITQTLVHRVGDAIQPSHPLSSPSALNISEHQGLFKWVSSSHQVAKVLEFQLQHQSFQWTPRTDL